MRQFNTFALLFAVFALVATAGCGGGGDGFAGAAAANPLVITSNSLPAILSGQSFADIGLPADYEIPLSGGCGGPYQIEVISGLLPPGMDIDFSVLPDGTPRHHIVGLAMEEGSFNFELKVTDTACTPFSTTNATYTYDISQGELTIVGANPGLIAHADYSDADPNFPDIDALETTVYGQFTSIRLIAAGGVGPYSASVVNDPNDPNDDIGLPLGTSIAVASTSVVGSPSQVGPGGAPFTITFRMTDSVGNTAFRKLWWKIDTPPVIISNTSITDGTVGQPLSDAFQIVDGVPPFRFELVSAVPGPDADGNPWSDVDYSGPVAEVLSIDPAFNPWGLTAGQFGLSAAGPSDLKLTESGLPEDKYPAETGLPGSETPYPSEGIYLVDEDINGGSLLGTPRRAGTFTIMVHAFSTLVPNNRGQHAFKPFTQGIAAPQPVVIDPSISLEGTFVGLPGDGYPTLAEAEQGVIYNPDQGSHPGPGLQCIASGGCPEDGFIDSPHSSTRLPAGNEVPGYYSWDADNDWDGQGAITGLTMFEIQGLFGTETQADANALPRQGRRQIEISVLDRTLPLGLNNPVSQVFGISVGPDSYILAHSTKSQTATASYWSAGGRHEWGNYTQNILKFQGFSSGPVRAKLSDADLSPSHTVPAIAFGTAPANPLGALLSGDTGGDATVDLHRPTPVATGWWDDNFFLNPKGARANHHADWAKGYAYLGQFGSSYSNHGNYQPSIANLDLPAAQVSANEDLGIYADGGRLFLFESGKRFGVFIVRHDASVYVPFAMEKDSSVEGFGDGQILTSADNRNTAFQTIQLTVSPDGRFAAFKLKKDAQNVFETAADSKIVVMSLAGEKVFDGKTYKIIGSGVGETGAGNRILHAPSMALTNSHLYFLIGSRSPTADNTTSSTYLYYPCYTGHYFMEYDVLGGASDASMMTSSDSAWTQDQDASMQTTYQHTGPVWSTTYKWWESSTTYGNWPYHRYWQENGMNFQEHGYAPTPFRVSADGTTVAFMAAQDNASTLSSNNYNTYGWVCREGSEPIRITTSRYHASMGSARGTTLTYGPREYAMWGMYSGPTTGLEISDDGNAVAFVYNTNSGSIYVYQSYSSSSHSWMSNRDDIHLSRTTNDWGTRTERNVTGTTFGTPHRWRFGALGFTEETDQDNGAGLVFWGGAPVYQGSSTSATYNYSYQTSGTMYCSELDSSSVESMLTTTEGGADGQAAGKSYTSSSQMDPSSTSGSTSSGDVASNRRYGCIQPMGGFYSKNRKFRYIMSYGALSTSDATGCKLVGLNITTTNSGSVNNHVNAEGDIPATWPARRGFDGNYIYYPWYPLYYGYAPMKKTGFRQFMNDETGVVYFMSTYQYTGPGRYYYYGGPPVRTYYYGAYGYGGTGLYAFNAEVNGAVASLHVPGTVSNSTSSSYWGLPQYLEVSRDGSRVMYAVVNYYYYDQHNAERLNHVKDLSFDPVTGALDTGKFNAADDSKKLEGANGRLGEGMVIPPNNEADAWYAFKASAGNENAMEMVKASVQPDDTIEFTRFPSLPGRMHIIFGAR